jgi:hypothetical protein
MDNFLKCLKEGHEATNIIGHVLSYALDLGTSYVLSEDFGIVNYAVAGVRLVSEMDMQLHVDLNLSYK